METNKINTVEMTRAIRDENARKMRGKTHAERIAFYQEQAAKTQDRVSSLLKETLSSETENQK